MRYTYVKHNNIVREFLRVGPDPKKIPQGGPDAYVAHFMHLVGDQPALLMSVHGFNPEKDEYIERGNVTVHSFYWFSRILKPLGNISKRPLGTFLPRLTKSLIMFWKLVKFRPDRVLCWQTSFPLWAVYLASQVVGAKFVYCRHTRISGGKDQWYQRITKKLDAWIMRHAPAVVCNGPYLKDQLLEIGVKPERIFEFNWSFRHLLIESAERVSIQQLDVNDNRRMILFIGRIHSHKGVFDLLNACTDRLLRDQSVVLAYAGDGAHLEELRTEVGKRGLNDKVKFLGMVPHDALANLIGRASLVVTPTRELYPEGRCMATMEGLIMGVPVIAPNFGPFPYLVKDRVNGLLYQVDSVEDLGAKISNGLDDVELYKRLRAGADKTGRELSDARVNFYDAIKSAFEYSEIASTLPRQNTQ